MIFSLLPLVPPNLTLLFISRAKNFQKHATPQGILLGCNVVGLRRNLVFLDNQNTASKESN